MTESRSSDFAQIRVTALSDSDLPELKSFLCGHRAALLYYSAAYKAFLEDILGCGSGYMLAWHGEKLAGMLPLMWRDGPFGRVINSLPFFGSHGGPLASTVAAEAALSRAFEAAARKPGVAAATFVENPFAALTSDIDIGADLRDSRIGQVTILDGGGDPISRLGQRIDGSARRNVRKAERSGVMVAIENERLDFLADVHRENMAEIGGRTKSARFFDILTRHFKADRDYRVYVARLRGEPVSALLLFYFNKTVEYFVPATRRQAREHQPMALILWQAMLDAIDRGVSRWNWGGTWASQDGVYRFKRKWGAIDLPYRYFTVLNDDSLLSHRAEELLDGYPNFFVVPFDQLR